MSDNIHEFSMIKTSIRIYAEIIITKRPLPGMLFAIWEINQAI